MKTWMSLVLILVCSVASANWRLHADGYYYFNNAGSPHTRYSYVQNGCTYYGYSPVQVYKSEVTQNFSYKTETKDYRDSLVELARTIEGVESFDRSFGALIQRYTAGRGGRYAPYHQQDLVTGGNPYQGNTVYSSKVEEVFGNPADIGELTGRFLRSFDSQRELASEIGKRGGELIDSQADRQERVAEILAKGQVAREVLRASDPQPRSRVSTSRAESVATRAVVGTGKLQALCKECHSGDSPSGGFDVANASAEQLEIAEFAVQVGAGVIRPADAAKILGRPVRGMPPKGKVPKEDLRELLRELRGVR